MLLLDATSPRVEPIWRTLQERSRPSFFCTWGWMENWIASLPKRARPDFAALLDDGEPVAACFLGRQRLLRRGLIPSRARFINASGIPRFDELCVEHNEVLGAAEAGVTLSELARLWPDDWDELFMPALRRDRSPGSRVHERPAGLTLRVDREVAAPYVDLEKVRASGYLGLLGASTRGQLKRARRNAGEVSAEVARDPTLALEIFEELVLLHSARWAERGNPGAFADPWIRSFHRRLIRKRLAHGEVQLLRVRAAEKTIGCLYNFVFGGRVLFYQSGLSRHDDPHDRPGYVCHAEAVRLNAEAGHSVYDFLAGGADYKRRLATDQVTLVWARAQRPLWRYRAEDAARGVWHRAAAVRLRNRAS